MDQFVILIRKPKIPIVLMESKKADLFVVDVEVDIEEIPEAE